MKIKILLFIALLVFASRDTTANAQSASPPAADHLVTSTAVKSLIGTRAVVYRSHGLKLGIEVERNGRTVLLWSTSLPGIPARVLSPGPAGLVDGIIRFPATSKAVVFAYLVQAGKVSSALAGHVSGQISAGEGAHFHGLDFTLQSTDASHIGSVKYRFDSRYVWSGLTYTLGTRIHVPDYAAIQYPRPSASVTSKSGDITLMRLEVANTQALQETGLMNRTYLDPDTGMIFVWNTLVLESFWMQDTYIPLSIAFLGPDGTVQEIQNMDALTETLHTPQSPYQYAIEANRGYFQHAGIVVGSKFALNLSA